MEDDNAIDQWWRGPYYGYFGGPVFKSEHFVRDIKALAQISDETFDRAMAALEQEAGFLGTDRVKAVLARHVEDGDLRRALTNFVVNLQRFRREAKQSAQEFARTFAQELESSGPKDLDKAVKKVVLSRIERLASENRAMERQAKAEQLAGRTGASLDDFCIVCDLRSIFDESRENVEAMLPMTLLKIVASRPEGIPETLEVQLKEKDLDRIFEDVARAKKKLATLQRLLDAKQIPIPDGVRSS